MQRREAVAGPASPALIPVMMAIMASSTAPAGRCAELARRALTIAEAAGAPPAVIALFGVAAADREARKRPTPSRSPARIDAFAASAARPAIAADPQSRSAVLLYQADALVAMRRGSQAAHVLDAVAADPALGGHHPIKVGALLRLASLRAAGGDLAGARAAYERTGLSAQRCALLDAKPAIVRRNSGSTEFSQEAMRWGFEGWARTEFDIDADGRTANVRSIIAYPPFVFSPASVTVLSGARFTQTYRPEGALGCGGSQQTIRFGLPGMKQR